ncbi:inositol monophosphatase family protein [Micromonospora haikouensis]|uniref:inositol monophosphatase family protein n=1 Tax=Micromonospora haikouensis TaxID=686309 RepID=UPI0034178F3A
MRSTILRGAVAAGAAVVSGYQHLLPVAEAAVARAVRAFLQAATPEIGFLGEEDGVHSTGEMQWVLDAIDGTANFVRGIPLCAVSLGLLHGDDAVLGVIEAPFLGNRYAAARGDGATVDGKPIRVSDTSRLSDAVVAIGDYAVGPDAAARNRSRLSLTARLASECG